MHPPLADWTEDYVKEIAAKREGFDLEPDDSWCGGVAREKVYPQAVGRRLD